jgi:hypothetical protein
VRFVDDDGRTKTVLLSKVRTTSIFLTGIEVDREGDEVSGAGFDERRRMIHKKTLLKRTPMKMDNKYAELVEEGQKVDLGGGWWGERAENEGPRGGRRGVFNAWHESNPTEVLTFEKLRSARDWAQEHPVELGAVQF